MLTYAATSGKTLCSGSADNLLRVWRLKDRVCTHTLKGHKNWILTLACSPIEERQLATGSADGSVRVWDLAPFPISSTVLKPPRSKAGDVTCCAYSPSATLLCTGAADKVVRLWTLPDGVCVRELHGHRGQINGLAFQGGSGRLVGSVEGNASAFHFSSDNAVILWDVLAPQGQEMLIRLNGHKRRVNACAFSTPGSLLVTGANDNTVRLHADVC